MLMRELEKRAFQRMMINAPVVVRQGEQLIDGICRDLSATGMSIVLPSAEVTTGEVLAVELAPGREGVAPLRAQAKVVRSEPQGEGVLIGIEFTSLS